MPWVLVRNGNICIAGKAKTVHLPFTCMERLNFVIFKYVYLFSEFNLIRQCTMNDRSIYILKKNENLNIDTLSLLNYD